MFRSEEVSLGRVPRLLNHVGDPKIKNLNSVFVSQDWQEIVALYETDNVYLGECYVTSRGNVSFSVCNTQHETHESSVNRNMQHYELNACIKLLNTFVCVPAEVASLLIRNVSYEGPALRKQLAKAQQLQQELSRREVECQSSAADLRERYYSACRQYGIRVSTCTCTRL